MERIRRSLVPSVVIAAALILILAQLLPGPAATAQAPGGMGPQSMPGGDPIVYYAVKGNGTFRVPPRVSPDSLGIQSATINVNYLAAGATLFGKTCKTWPTDAQTAFNYAAGIWAATLNSTVASTINACWTTLGTGILGSSGASSYWRDFTGAPQANTWYPAALANALGGVDQDPSTAEMNIVYSDAFSWYFGTDGVTPPGQYDLVSVVLHEIAHGFGFAGTMYSASGSGVANWGFSSMSGYPGAYDRFTENGSGQSLISAFSNNSAALLGQLTSNNVYFNGSHAKAANGGSRPPLYAPTTWAQGSSYAHLAESFNGTTNALMTYSIADGSSIHDAGPVGLGVLQDVGWTMTTAPTPTPTATPTATPVPAPDVSIQKAAILSRPFTPGDRITYTLTVANVGNRPANGVRVTDTLPASLVAPISYASNLVITSTGGANYAWTVAPLAAGASGVISVYARISPSLPATGTVINTALISDPQDGNPANNSSTVFVGGVRVYLPLVMHSYSGSTDTPTPTATATSVATATPTVVPGSIHGHVTVSGAAASGLSLNLRFYNGSAWSTWGSTTINSSGDYAFVGAPTLAPGHAYYVRYDNNLSSNTRLALWRGPILNSYTSGSTVAGGTFDLANIVLSSPAGDSLLPLPVTFQWSVRSATPSDSYEFDIYEYATGSGMWWTSPLGYVGQYVLSAVPAGFTYPNTYAWYVAVYSPDGGYGESYYVRTIMFTNGIMSAADVPLARPGRDLEQRPLTLEP